MADIKRVRYPVPGGIVRGLDGKEYECTHIECSVGYSLGGYNYWCGGVDPRGYYAHISPVKVEGMWVTRVLGAGGKHLLVGCARRSPKREAEAIAKFDAEAKDYVAHLYETCAVDFAAAS